MSNENVLGVAAEIMNRHRLEPKPDAEAKLPCGECHLQENEVCDICGAAQPKPDADAWQNPVCTKACTDADCCDGSCAQPKPDAAGDAKESPIKRLAKMLEEADAQAIICGVPLPTRKHRDEAAKWWREVLPGNRERAATLAYARMCAEDEYLREVSDDGRINLRQPLSAPSNPDLAAAAMESERQLLQEREARIKAEAERDEAKRLHNLRAELHDRAVIAAEASEAELAALRNDTPKEQQ